MEIEHFRQMGNSKLNLRSNQNIQALALVAVFVAIIAIGIAFLRPHKPESYNLDIQLNGDNVTIAVPNCDISRFQDRFFMHIYESTAKDSDAVPFIGRDFDLSSEPRRTSANSAQCM